MPVARRRDAAVPIDVPPGASPRSAVERVIVRLLLLARDEATGEELLVGSFLKGISMPPDLGSPQGTITLEIFGERRVFEPTDIIWDESDGVCIVEVEWMVGHGGPDSWMK
jgi:hypothetical protein